MPRVIIGCWQLLERHSDRNRAIQTLLSYAKAGFLTFDTADIYGPSEGILGEFRRQWRGQDQGRPDVRFFTKYVTDDPGLRQARRINGQSLTNLGVEAADMVQFHWWSLEKDGSDLTFLKAGRHLATLKEEGTIRHVAGCNMDTTHLKLLVDDGVPIEANQVQYSLIDRRPEFRLLRYCKDKGIKLTVFGVVGGGLLSEGFLGLSMAEARPKLDSVSRRMYWSSLQRWSSDWALFQQLLSTLKKIGESKKPPLPIASVACLWTLRRMDDLGAGGSIILGVRDDRHLAEHTALLDGVELSDADMLAIAEVLDRGLPPSSDIWSFERGWA